MSSLKLKGRNQAPLTKLAHTLKANIATQGADFVSAGQTNTLISMEGFSDQQAASLQSTFDQVRSDIRDELKKFKLGAGFGFEALADGCEDPEAIRQLDTALDAGAMAAMAAGNPVAYAQQAYNGQPVATGENVTLVDTMALQGGANSMDYRANVAMEAFNEQELRDHLPYSILFNVFASRQDDFSEMLFPTTVVPPDQAGLDITVARMQVFNEVRHQASGAKIDFGKRNLIDAAIDHTILADEHTRLVPVVLEDGSNADKFVDEAVVPTFFQRVGNFDVPTSALKLDETIDLLGISQWQPLLGAGVIDHSDDVDARVVLSELYLQSADGAVAVKFPVERLARNQFNKTTEGNSRLTGLQFTSTDLVIDKNSKALDGTDVAAFAGIVTGEYTVRLSVNVSGELNHEFGNIKVWASKVSVASIQDKNGNAIPTSAGAGKAVADALKPLSIIGYTIRANRTNANKRTRGHLLDTVYETQRYTIPLGSPLSITSPVSHGDARDAADQKTLIAAARMRNSNNAVTALFAIADQLREVTKGPKLPAGEYCGVGGLGRFLVDPFFEEHTVDLVQCLNSIKSQDRALDISSVLVNVLRDIAYRMYRDTKIQPAIDAQTGTTGEAPILLVGTDQVLIRHLLINGDSRTFGTVFDKAVVKASLDRRMYGKIVLTLTRANAEGPDPLTFGTHAWMSELIATMPISRNGATTKEATVQPRTLHINNMPVLAIVSVKGLSKVLVDKTSTPAIAAAVTNVYLDGLKYPTL